MFSISTSITLPIPFVMKFRVPPSPDPSIVIPPFPEKAWVAFGVSSTDADATKSFFNLRLNTPVSSTVTSVVPVTVISSKNVTLLSIAIFSNPEISWCIFIPYFPVPLRSRIFPFPLASIFPLTIALPSKTTALLFPPTVIATPSALVFITEFPLAINSFPVPVIFTAVVSSAIPPFTTVLSKVSIDLSSPITTAVS